MIPRTASINGFGPKIWAYNKALALDPRHAQAWRGKADLYDWVDVKPKAYYQFPIRSLSIPIPVEQK